MKFGIGQSVKRVEDRRFLTGQGAWIAPGLRPRIAAMARADGLARAQHLEAAE